MSAMPVALFLSEFGIAATARRDAPFVPFGGEGGAASPGIPAETEANRIEAARAS
jgi:hypothetical protein